MSFIDDIKQRLRDASRPLPGISVIDTDAGARIRIRTSDLEKSWNIQEIGGALTVGGYVIPGNRWIGPEAERISPVETLNKYISEAYSKATKQYTGADYASTFVKAFEERLRSGVWVGTPEQASVRTTSGTLVERIVGQGPALAKLSTLTNITGLNELKAWPYAPEATRSQIALLPIDDSASKNIFKGIQEEAFTAIPYTYPLGSGGWHFGAALKKADKVRRLGSSNIEAMIGWNPVTGEFPAGANVQEVGFRGVNENAVMYGQYINMAVIGGAFPVAPGQGWVTKAGSRGEWYSPHTFNMSINEDVLRSGALNEILKTVSGATGVGDISPTQFTKLFTGLTGSQVGIDINSKMWHGMSIIPEKSTIALPLEYKGSEIAQELEKVLGSVEYIRGTEANLSIASRLFQRTGADIPVQLKNANLGVKAVLQYDPMAEAIAKNLRQETIAPTQMVITQEGIKISGPLMANAVTSALMHPMMGRSAAISFQDNLLERLPALERQARVALLAEEAANKRRIIQETLGLDLSKGPIEINEQTAPLIEKAFNAIYRGIPTGNKEVNTALQTFRRLTGYEYNENYLTGDVPIATIGSVEEGLSNPLAVAFLPKVYSQEGEGYAGISYNQSATAKLIRQSYMEEGINADVADKYASLLAEQIGDYALLAKKVEAQGGPTFPWDLSKNVSGLRISKGGVIHGQFKVPILKAPVVTNVRPGIAVRSEGISMQALNMIERTAPGLAEEFIQRSLFGDKLGRQRSYLEMIAAANNEAIILKNRDKQPSVIDIGELDVNAAKAKAMALAEERGMETPSARELLQAYNEQVMDITGGASAMLKTSVGGVLPSPRSIMYHSYADPITGKPVREFPSSYIEAINTELSGDAGPIEKQFAYERFTRNLRRTVYNGSEIKAGFVKGATSVYPGGKFGGILQENPLVGWGEAMPGLDQLRSMYTGMMQTGALPKDATFNEFVDAAKAGEVLAPITRYATSQAKQFSIRRIVTPEFLANEGRIHESSYKSLEDVPGNSLIIPMEFSIQHTSDTDADLGLGVPIAMERNAEGRLVANPKMMAAWQKERISASTEFLANRYPNLAGSKFASTKLLAGEQSEGYGRAEDLTTYANRSNLMRRMSGMGIDVEGGMRSIMLSSNEAYGKALMALVYGSSVDVPSAMVEYGENTPTTREERIAIHDAISSSFQSVIDYGYNKNTSYYGIDKAYNAILTINKGEMKFGVLKEDFGYHYEEGAGMVSSPFGDKQEIIPLQDYLPRAIYSSLKKGGSPDVLEAMFRYNPSGRKEQDKAMLEAFTRAKGLDTEAGLLEVSNALRLNDIPMTKYLENSYFGVGLLYNRVLPWTNKMVKRGISNPVLSKWMNTYGATGASIPFMRGKVKGSGGIANIFPYFSAMSGTSEVNEALASEFTAQKVNRKWLTPDINEVISLRKQQLSDVTNIDEIPYDVKVQASMLNRPATDLMMQSVMSWDWRSRMTEESLTAAGVPKEKIEQLKKVYGESIFSPIARQATVYGSTVHKIAEEAFQTVFGKDVVSNEQELNMPERGISGRGDILLDMPKLREFGERNPENPALKYLLGNEGFKRIYEDQGIKKAILDIKSSWGNKGDRAEKLRSVLPQLEYYRQAVAEAYGLKREEVAAGVAVMPLVPTSGEGGEIATSKAETKSILKRAVSVVTANPEIGGDAATNQVIEMLKSAGGGIMSPEISKDVFSGTASTMQMIPHGARVRLNTGERVPVYDYVFGNEEQGIPSAIDVTSAASQMFRSALSGAGINPLTSAQWRESTPVQRYSLLKNMAESLLSPTALGYARATANTVASIGTISSARENPLTDIASSMMDAAFMGIGGTKDIRGESLEFVRDISRGASGTPPSGGPPGGPHVTPPPPGEPGGEGSGSDFNPNVFFRELYAKIPGMAQQYVAQSWKARTEIQERQRMAELMRKYTPEDLMGGDPAHGVPPSPVFKKDTSSPFKSYDNSLIGQVTSQGEKLGKTFEELAKSAVTLKESLEPASKEFKNFFRQLGEAKSVFSDVQSLLRDQSDALKGHAARMTAEAKSVWSESPAEAQEYQKRADIYSAEAQQLDILSESLAKKLNLPEIESAQTVMRARAFADKDWQAAEERRQQVGMFGGSLGYLGFGLFNLHRVYSWTIGKEKQWGAQYAEEQQALAQAAFEQGGSAAITPAMLSVLQQKNAGTWLTSRLGGVFQRSWGRGFANIATTASNLPDWALQPIVDTTTIAGGLLTTQIAATVGEALIGKKIAQYGGMQLAKRLVTGLGGEIVGAGGTAAMAGAAGLGVSIGLPVLGYAYKSSVDTLLSGKVGNIGKLAGLSLANLPGIGTAYWAGRAGDAIWGKIEDKFLPGTQQGEELSLPDNFEEIAKRNGLSASDAANLYQYMSATLGHEPTAQQFEAFARANMAIPGGVNTLAGMTSEIQQAFGFVSGSQGYEDIFNLAQTGMTTVQRQQYSSVARAILPRALSKGMSTFADMNTLVESNIESLMGDYSGNLALFNVAQQRQNAETQIFQLFGISPGETGLATTQIQGLVGNIGAEQEAIMTKYASLAQPLARASGNYGVVSTLVLGNQIQRYAGMTGVTPIEAQRVIAAQRGQLGYGLSAGIADMSIRGVIDTTGLHKSGVTNVNTYQYATNALSQFTWMSDEEKLALLQSVGRETFRTQQEASQFELASLGNLGPGINAGLTGQLATAFDIQYLSFDPQQRAVANAITGSMATNPYMTRKDRYELVNRLVDERGMTPGMAGRIASVVAPRDIRSWSAGALPGYKQYLAEGDPRKRADFQGLVDLAGNKQTLYNEWSYGDFQGRPMIEYQTEMANLGTDIQIQSANWDVVQRKHQIATLQREYGGESGGLATQEYNIRRQMWKDSAQYQQESLNLQRESLNLTIAQARIQREYSKEVRESQREFSLTQRQWTREDLSTAENRFEIQTSWTREDLDRQIRYSSGLQRQALLRQRDRMDIQDNWRRSDFAKTERRNEQTWAFQDENYSRLVNYVQKSTELEERRFQLQSTSINLQQDLLNKQLKAQSELNDIQDKRFDDQRAFAEEQLKNATAMLELEEQRRDLLTEWNDDVKKERDAEKEIMREWLAYLKSMAPPTGGEGDEGEPSLPTENGPKKETTPPSQNTGGSGGGAIDPYEKHHIPESSANLSAMSQSSSMQAVNTEQPIVINLVIDGTVIASSQVSLDLHRQLHEIDLNL